MQCQHFSVTQGEILKNQKLYLYRGKMCIIYLWKTWSEYSYVFDYLKIFTLKNYKILIKIVYEYNPKNNTLLPFSIPMSFPHDMTILYHR